MELNSSSNRKMFNNTMMLYFLTIAKLIFPICTLPYLTRVLSIEAYGAVSYVKSFISYFQLFIDFGFILSGVSDIVKCNGDKNKISYITSHVLLGRIFLAAVSLIVGLVFSFVFPILKGYFLFSFLSIIAVCLSCFLLEFLFRGLEKMHVITIIYVTMKGISTLLTFVLVKSDSNILLIPILDIIGIGIAIILTSFYVKKYEIIIKIFDIKYSFLLLKQSFTYFSANIATTAFGALNTILIGTFIIDITEVSYWSISFQIISAIQSLYSPIINGIYPQMIKDKSLKVVKFILLICLPIILFGCLFCYLFADYILLIIGGKKYVEAAFVFKMLLPLLIVSFPVLILGWPVLGAIGHQKEVSLSVVIGALVQVIGLFILLLCNAFTIFNIAILRSLSECAILILRIIFFIKYKNEFR